MQADLFLVIGCVVGILAVPALLSAFTHGHAPRAAAIMVLISGGLIALAVHQNPQGYRVEDVPRVFAGVVNRYLP
ncbi:hypothetical protein SAMN05444722_2108 [Rhodovulum sp. ES.010]|uniref:hypothetical protein n=1 Tax=Rhodovulum sp. ES.010 TaxID=1882821 RepID=UPI000926475C|nr:hypothetical protein [Rhodovulum sp. ES.010]SIO43175.1 hypothetical protein SAMN05444722_2108 [Rhodovulum sp. ES.010]